MIWVWLFNVVIWLVKLPFYLLPSATFLALPSQLTGAVYTLGQYTKWFVFLLGDTIGNAITLVILWSIPVLIAAYLWRIFITVGHKVVFGFFGRGTGSG